MAGVAYYDNSTGVNVLVYSFNQFGDPISGTPVNMTVTVEGSAQSTVRSTNGSGYAHLVVDIPYPSTPNNSLIVSVGTQGLPGQPGLYAQIPPPSGAIDQVFGNIAPVEDHSNPLKIDVAVFWTGPLGAPPLGYSVYYQVYGPGQGGFSFNNESSMLRLGSLTTDFQIFSFPADANITASDSVAIAIFDPSGNSVTGYGTGGNVFESPTQSRVDQQAAVQGFASSFIGSLMALIIPLMAVLASYSTYGKDRVSGVLDSVLARPVSRRGLSVSRFASTSLAMVVAVALSTAALDLVVYILNGFFLGGAFVATTMAALSVEAVAFVGLMFTLSRVIRSGGALVGIGVGLWAILEIFWNVFIYLFVVVSGIQFGSELYFRITADSGFFNPAQFYGLVTTLTSSTLSSLGFQFNPADYWINPYTVAAAGVLWVVLPFALFLYLAVKKD